MKKLTEVRNIIEITSVLCKIIGEQILHVISADADYCNSVFTCRNGAVTATKLVQNAFTRLINSAGDSFHLLAVTLAVTGQFMIL